MEPEFYAEYRKQLQWRRVMADRPGMEWDPLNRKWRPVDYINMTEEQLAERRERAQDRVAETKAQVEGLLPTSAAQALLNKGADELMEMVIKLIKRSPKALLGAI